MKSEEAVESQEELEDGGEQNETPKAPVSKVGAVEGQKFTRDLKEIPFQVDEDEYVLRELKSKERDAYMNDQNKRIVSLSNGTNKIKDFAGIQVDLLGKCVYKLGADKPVLKAELQEWPAGVQQKIFDAAIEMNGLSEEADKKKLEKETKNS